MKTKTVKTKNITVEYWMKGAPKQTAAFSTRKEANFFMEQLNADPECEGYGIVKN